MENCNCTYGGFAKGQWTLLFDQLMDITDAAKIDETHLAITYSTPTIPSRLAVFDLTSGELELVADPNEASDE